MANELKKWLRDSMLRFMLFYPVLFALIGRYLVPWLADTAGFEVELFADVILVVLVLIIPQVYGAIMGFSLLEDRDDKILTSIRVTPLSIHGFLSVRIIIMVALSFIACIFVILFSNIISFTWLQLIVIASLASLLAPFTGLLINSLSSNKIEGFAVMKGVGTLLILPVVSLFFFDAKELMFSPVPGYWPAKVISSIVRGDGILYLAMYQYIAVGFGYIIMLNIIMYRVFIRRIIRKG
ncbi:ABC transporter permease [Desulfuribacillus alkaliarsenatis]|uniref:ABC transporter permease n=2 Tax=Desulfuribacillus alkaliarsenatis TaxID=766136 RepID=A0A1E5G3B9_9FIRM|nr:ABC transporter permease [Desulfuribacillus alkaliarsenatis]